MDPGNEVCYKPTNGLLLNAGKNKTGYDAIDVTVQRFSGTDDLVSLPSSPQETAEEIKNLHMAHGDCEDKLFSQTTKD